MASKAASKGVHLPVVVVLGSTGVGKSKLAVELAKEFDGEVINADSMQVRVWPHFRASFAQRLSFAGKHGWHGALHSVMGVLQRINLQRTNVCT
jgi:gluconate kinase